VPSGRDWQWSSLRDRLAKAPALPTAQWPVERPSNWLALVDRPMQKSDAEAVRTSLTRDRPLGDPLWTLETAHRLGLDYTLRPRGRPRVRSENE
jgi:putative transposase